jgi:hypothetical protein
MSFVTVAKALLSLGMNWSQFKRAGPGEAAEIAAGIQARWIEAK